MLTQTSELAIRTLIYLALKGGQEPLSPRQLSEEIDCSPSYLAKTLRMLVHSGILLSVRGAHGGVLLERDPETITLLDVVEACQGLVIGDYCQVLHGRKTGLCGFHQAMDELHQETIRILSGWTLKDLLSCPMGRASRGNGLTERCKMSMPGLQDAAIQERGRS